MYGNGPVDNDSKKNLKRKRKDFCFLVYKTQKICAATE